MTTAPHPDLALVQRALAREDAAQQEVARRTDAVARRAVEHLSTRSPVIRAHADDLVQRFALMLLEKDGQALRSYAGRASLETWTRVIASRFFLRSAGRIRRDRPIDDEMLGRLEDPGPSPQAQEEQRATDAAVRRAVEKLSEQDQLLLALIYEQDVPAHAAGKVLGLSGSGVRMRKKRLFEKLSKSLKSLVT